MDLDASLDMAVGLLKELIRNPSVSREEEQAADLLEVFMEEHGLKVHRRHHNLWTAHQVSDSKPNILLNSHLDTVKPVAGWKRDPFTSEVEGDRLYGLGSNDAGGPLVALLACFLYFAGRQDNPFNLIFAASAEEEVSGEKGVTSQWKPVSCSGPMRVIMWIIKWADILTKKKPKKPGSSSRKLKNLTKPKIKFQDKYA